jgi:hypothetical protein
MRVSNRKSNRRRGFLDFSIKVRVLSVGRDERVRVAIASRQLQKALHSIVAGPIAKADSSSCRLQETGRYTYLATESSSINSGT